MGKRGKPCSVGPQRAALGSMTEVSGSDNPFLLMVKSFLAARALRKFWSPEVSSLPAEAEPFIVIIQQ